MGYYSSMIILLPAIILSIYASFKVKKTFEKYSKVISPSGYTGAEIAKQILQLEGIYDVRVESIRGDLTDHYDPRAKVVRLSDKVYDRSSISAIAVAAHECGHAIQHNTGYAPLNFRSAFVPIASLSSKASMPLIFIGFLIGGQSSIRLINIGILLFAATVIFQVVTLPVEFNASSRAIKVMLNRGIITERDEKGTRDVLQAAALTYVAAALSSLLSLLRLIIVSNGRR